MIQEAKEAIGAVIKFSVRVGPPVVGLYFGGGAPGIEQVANLAPRTASADGPITPTRTPIGFDRELAILLGTPTPSVSRYDINVTVNLPTRAPRLSTPNAVSTPTPLPTRDVMLDTLNDGLRGVGREGQYLTIEEQIARGWQRNNETRARIDRIYNPPAPTATPDREVKLTVDEALKIANNQLAQVRDREAREKAAQPTPTIVKPTVPPIPPDTRSTGNEGGFPWEGILLGGALVGGGIVGWNGRYRIDRFSADHSGKYISVRDWIRARFGRAPGYHP